MYCKYLNHFFKIIIKLFILIPATPPSKTHTLYCIYTADMVHQLFLSAPAVSTNNLSKILSQKHFKNFSTHFETHFLVILTYMFLKMQTYFL